MSESIISHPKKVLTKGGINLAGRYAGLVVLLIIYIVLVSNYSRVIPFSKGPDEYINYQYILFIAKNHRLPSTINERQEAGVKADWQPLYHILGGLTAAHVPLTPPSEIKVTWEPPTRQLIDLVLPRATLVRTEDERFPHWGEYAVWQIGRQISWILGAGTLIVTFFTCLVLWPKKPALATGTTALLVFIPRFLFTYAVLSDDTMLGFCLALYLLLLVRLIIMGNHTVDAGGQEQTLHTDYSPVPIPGSQISLWYFASLGITAGLAIITKYTAIPVVAGAFVSGVLAAYLQRWQWPDIFKRGAIFAGSLLLATGWWVGWVWWHFNQIITLGPVLGLVKPLLPGGIVDDNPTTSRLTALLSGQSVAGMEQAPGAGGNFFDWAQHTFATFWGITVYGAEPLWPLYPYYFILAGIAILCGIALLGLWRVYRQILPETRIVFWALVIHLLIFFPLPMLRFALSHRLNDAAQGRHLLFPAGPAVVMLLMMGWLVWIRPSWRNWIALAIGSLMLVWGLGHLGYLWSAYPPPIPVRTTPGPSMQVKQTIQVNFADTLQLIGYQTKLSRDGSTLQLDLLWQSLNQAWEDYRTEITLVDGQDRPQLRWISHPVNGRFPVRSWQPGDLVRDTLYIPVVGLKSGDYKVQLRLLGWDEALDSTTGKMISLTPVTLERIPIFSQATLWQQGAMFQGTQPVYRYRSTIAVTLPETSSAYLLGPDDQPQFPVTDVGHLFNFIVDYNWPSGNYELYIDGIKSALTLTVENFDNRPNGWSFTPPAMMYPVQANFANKLELIGYDLPTRRSEAGGGIPLVLYWQGLAQMREDYTMFVQLLDPNLEKRGGYDRFPRENYNTYLWVPGEVVDDGFAVPVDNTATDGVYTIRIGWYLQENGQPITLPLVQNGQFLAETSIVIGPVKVGQGPSEWIVQEISPTHPLDIHLDEFIVLRGYDYDLEKEVSIIRLQLYWQSLVQTKVNYTVFVHLRDQNGNLVAQTDAPPAAGKYPTSLWDSGEIISDTFTLPLPPNIESGVYQLVVGLYDPMTGDRLSIPQTMDNSILLTKISLD